MVDSRIEQVTVYQRGAAVRRVASASGPGIVQVAGLPAAAIDDTVRVEVEGGPVAVSIRVATDAAAEGAPEESGELRAVRRREAIATAEVVRLETALDRLAKAPVVVDDDSEDKAAWAAVVAARKTLVEVRAAREASLRGALAAARRELDEAHRAHEVVAMREALKGNAHEAKAHELKKHVEIELVGGGAATLRIEYQVAAARWAPAYVARLDGEAARFELRAVVAQDSGEDWRDVAVKLSTAEPARFAQLPELAAQKIGRKQAEPVKKGFRAAPVGADALYADYERTWPRTAKPVGAVVAFDDAEYEDNFAQQVWDEDSSHAKGYPAAESPMPMVAKRRSGGPLSALSGAVASFGESVARAPSPSRAAPPGAPPMQASPMAGSANLRARGEPAPAAPRPRLDYGHLVMAPASSPERGKLVPAPSEAGPSARVAGGVAKVAQLALPPGHVDEWDHAYDFAFAGDGNVDIASDGAWHSIALTARAGTAQLRHVAVPREQQDVFRIAEVGNPFDGPLLPGPIDVYDRGQFLVTSEVDYTPPGGRVAIGLGVDPQVKIARNAEFHEEAAGMLRGALRLVHAVTVEVENVSPRAVDVEVRERVPVTREGDDDIEVTLGRVEPAWEAWSPEPHAPGEAKLRGGQRWRVTVPPAGKKLLRAGYEVRIPAKAELVGGNRREP